MRAFPRATIALAAALAASAWLVASLPAAAAGAASLNCGDTVTTDTVLDRDLYCPSGGIDVNAVLDLGGHTVTGRGRALGFHVAGPGAAVINGTIAGFGDGAYLENGARIQDVTITGSSSNGVHLHGGTVENSVITGSGSDAIRNMSGRGSAVLRNTIVGNAGDGISVTFTADDGRYIGNRILNNGGAGLSIETSTSQVVDNLVQHNGQDGITIVESRGSLYAGGYFLQGNSSNFNGGYGIYACASGWDEPACGGVFDDGGGNSAKGNNGGGVQCLSIVCATNQGQARKDASPPEMTLRSEP